MHVDIQYKMSSKVTHKHMKQQPALTACLKMPDSSSPFASVQSSAVLLKTLSSACV